MSACACYCSGPSWTNYFAGYFYLSAGACTASNCAYYFPSYCRVGYPISAQYYTPSGSGISTGATAGIAVVCGIAAICLFGLACYFFKKSADKKKAAQQAAMQGTVIQTDVYKSGEGAYPGAEQPVMPGASYPAPGAEAGYYPPPAGTSYDANYNPNAAGAYYPPPPSSYDAQGGSQTAGVPSTSYAPPSNTYAAPPMDASTSYAAPSTGALGATGAASAGASYAPPPTEGSASYAPPAYETVPAQTVAPEKSKPPGS